MILDLVFGVEIRSLRSAFGCARKFSNVRISHFLKIPEGKYLALTGGEDLKCGMELALGLITVKKGIGFESRFPISCIRVGTTKTQLLS